MHIMDLLTDGGAFALVTLGVGLGGVALAVVVTLVIGFLRWRVPASLGWLGLTVAVALGAAGGVYNTAVAQGVAGLAPPEQRMMLLAGGVVGGLVPLLFGAMLAASGLLLAAWGTAITAAVRPGPAPKFTWKAAGTSVGVGLLAFVAVLGILVGTRGVGALLDHAVVLAVAVLGAGATVVASSRVASEDRGHQGRIAGSRGAVLVAASLAVVLGGAVGWGMDILDAFSAVASAAEVDKPAMLEAGIAAAGSGLSAAFLLALIPLASGFAGLSSIFGRADGRVATGAGVGGAQVLVMLAAVYVVHGSTLAALRDMVAQIVAGGS